jgi:hypothetical protein
LYDELKLSGFSWFSALPSDGEKDIDPENPAAADDGEDSQGHFLQQGVTSASVRKRPGSVPEPVPVHPPAHAYARGGAGH